MRSETLGAEPFGLLLMSEIEAIGWEVMPRAVELR